MIRNILAACAATFLLVSPTVAQFSVGGVPYSLRNGLSRSAVPTVTPAAFDAAAVAVEDKARAEAGAIPAYGRTLTLNASPASHGTWTELVNGDRLWRLRIASPGAVGTELFFSDLVLPEGAVMHVYDDEGGQLLGGFTAANNKASGIFTTGQLAGEACIVEYYEPLAVAGTGSFMISEIGHAYRFVGGAKADACEVDVNCVPEGSGQAAQRDGVVRVGVKEGTVLGWCSGSLVNNMNLDCKSYYLTAFHCGVNASATDFTAWKFYYKYQRPGCGTGTATTGSFLTGCTKRASSNDGGGNTGSDFLLLEGDDAIPTNYNPYWMGWDANEVNPGSGVRCIHHPAGDEKKISTVNTISSSSFWNGINTPFPTHYRVTWSATTNGHGVTEGGSSGSPIYNSSGQIVGTLTGGQSYCNSTAHPNGQLAPDFYGKMSFHWDKNGGPADQKLKYWLDPNNTGNKVLNGSYGPCGTLGVEDQATEAAPALAPNPTNDMVRVTLPSTLSGADRIEVLDVSGRLVLTTAIQGALVNELDLRYLVSGTYLVRVVGDGLVSGATRLSLVR